MAVKSVTKLCLLFALAIGNSSGRWVSTKNDYCLSEDSNPYLYYGTKTAYEFVRSNEEFPIEECEPVQFWLLTRHGTRFGTKGNLQEMKDAQRLQREIINNYESGSLPFGLCEKDYQALKNWTWDASMEAQAGFLNEQGWRDLFNLAKRYQIRYPQLLEGYSQEKFYFRHTLTQRTEASCKAFVEGLFGSELNVTIEEPLEVDNVIKPYEHCAAWIEEVDDNEETEAEVRKFRESAEFNSLLRNVSRRLAFNRTLNPVEIDAMYDNCRLDKTRYLNPLSPWCTVFVENELKLLEYDNDLARYYKSGHGHEYNAKLGCTSLKNMMETFEATVEQGTRGSTVALFTHDSMMDMTFSAMGYSKDERHLSGSDFEDLLESRKYRTSFNTPFTSNMVVVLHRCSNPTQEYKVRFFHNEKPMELDWCEQGVCGWEQLQNSLSFVKDCNLDFCDMPKRNI